MRRVIERLRLAYWNWRLSQHGLLPIQGGAMTRNERQLKAVEQEMERRSKSIQDIWKKAEDEERETSAEERGDVEKELKAIEQLKQQKGDLTDSIKVEQDVKKLAGEIKPDDQLESGSGLELPNGFQGVQVVQHSSIGEQFVESKGYKDAIARAGLTGGGIPQDFSTGPVGLSGFPGMPIEGKGTLLEGAGAPGAGTGGGLITVPQVQPGVVEKYFQRLTVADLIPQATTGTNTVRYVVEGTATSGAAGVAEGGSKPESTLALSTVDEPVKKIATSLTVSEEMLEDAAQTQGYINGRLSLFVKIEDERQLVLGGGTNELVGITGRSGVTSWARGTVDSNAVAIFKAMNGQRGSSFLEPSAIIMNPANWQTTRLATDSAGQFMGGGPFMGQYGNGGMAGNSSQLGGALDTLWGKPVVVTTAIGAGTAFVGAFDTAAQIFRRSGITVEASNQHNDYFTKNLVAIRAEERLALAVYRPPAFTLVTGLN
jgi:HK97 family phage major capsid protein